MTLDRAMRSHRSTCGEWPDKALAEKLRSQLLEGASFEALAKQHSVAPTALRGGRLGQVPLKRLRTEFRQALSGLPANQPSKVVPTEGGSNILMRFGVPEQAKDQAAPKAQEADPGEKFLLARQKTMAGMERHNAHRCAG